MNLKVSAFCLEKQRSFFPKKKTKKLCLLTQFSRRFCPFRIETGNMKIPSDRESLWADALSSFNLTAWAPYNKIMLDNDNNVIGCFNESNGEYAHCNFFWLDKELSGISLHQDLCLIIICQKKRPQITIFRAYIGLRQDCRIFRFTLQPAKMNYIWA